MQNMPARAMTFPVTVVHTVGLKYDYNQLLATSLTSLS